MHIVHILILAIVQGIAELLPVSSSAHVIVAEKLMGLDATSAQMTLLLVMLHCGTMLAVICYFYKSWRYTYFRSWDAFVDNLKALVVATCATGLVGLALLFGFKRYFRYTNPNFEIEDLFGNLHIIAGALAIVGVFIIISSFSSHLANKKITTSRSWIIGLVQGLCLPFRGFSRSGATISTSLVLGIERVRAEEFSFALAVVLTPVVVAKEGYRLYQHQLMAPPAHAIHWASAVQSGLLGMVFSFLAGLTAMRWLSKWLESDKWYLFGIYCLVAAGTVWSMS